MRSNSPAKCAPSSGCWRLKVLMILPQNYNLLPIADRPTLIIILQISLLNEPRRRKEREGREERAFSHFQV
jgi:hypothetical protein